MEKGDYLKKLKQFIERTKELKKFIIERTHRGRRDNV